MTKTKKRLPRILTLTLAKQNYATILDRVHTGKEKFIVHSRGYAEAVVIVSVGEYLSAFTKTHPGLRALRREANVLGLEKWKMEKIRAE
jgi:prevent-host-death family protein